jgi:hypothetical protein
MSYHPEDPDAAVTPPPLCVGDRILLDHDPSWWTVAAVSPNFTACTRPAEPRDLDPDDVDGDMEDLDPSGPVYTVLDWRSGVRGPCNLMGQSYGDGTYSPDQCAEMLAAFEVTDDDIRAAMTAHRISGPDEPFAALADDVPMQLEVSQRNHVPLRVRAIEHATVGS